MRVARSAGTKRKVCLLIRVRRYQGGEKTRNRQYRDEHCADNREFVLPEPMPGILPERMAGFDFTRVLCYRWKFGTHCSKRNLGFIQTCTTSTSKFMTMTSTA